MQLPKRRLASRLGSRWLMEQLQRHDMTRNLRVVRPIDVPHPARAHLLLDLVTPPNDVTRRERGPRPHVLTRLGRGRR